MSVIGSTTASPIVTGTIDYGIARITGNVRLKDAEVTSGTNGISVTTGNVSNEINRKV